MFNRKFVFQPFYNAEGGAGAGGGEGGGAGEGEGAKKTATEKVVPYERFTEINNAKKALEDQIKSYSEFGDAETLKQKLAKLSDLEKAADEAEKARLSDIEKAQLAVKEAQEKAASLEKQTQELQEARKSDLINAEIRIQAIKAGVVDVDAALLLADKSAVQIQDGKVVGADVAIEALKEAKSYLFGKADPKPVGSATNGKSTDAQAAAEEQLKDLADKIRKFGRMEDKIAYSEIKRKLGL